MAKKDAVFIVGAMAIGVAVSESPFLLYPDLMFKNSGFDSQSSAWTYGIRGDHSP